MCVSEPKINPGSDFNFLVECLSLSVRNFLVECLPLSVRTAECASACVYIPHELPMPSHQHPARSRGHAAILLWVGIAWWKGTIGNHPEDMQPSLHVLRNTAIECTAAKAAPTPCQIPST